MIEKVLSYKKLWSGKNWTQKRPTELLRSIFTWLKTWFFIRIIWWY